MKEKRGGEEGNKWGGRDVAKEWGKLQVFPLHTTNFLCTFL
jgi:hypothetical protein